MSPPRIRVLIHSLSRSALEFLSRICLRRAARRHHRVSKGRGGEERNPLLKAKRCSKALLASFPVTLIVSSVLTIEYIPEKKAKQGTVKLRELEAKEANEIQIATKQAIAGRRLRAAHILREMP